MRARKILAETNTRYAIIKVLRSTKNFNFYPQKINGNIHTIHLWKSNGIFFGCDNDFGITSPAAIDHIQNFLLSKTMMIRILFGINQLSAQPHQDLFETIRH